MVDQWQWIVSCDHAPMHLSPEPGTKWSRTGRLGWGRRGREKTPTRWSRLPIESVGRCHPESGFGSCSGFAVITNPCECAYYLTACCWNYNLSVIFAIILMITWRKRELETIQLGWAHCIVCLVPSNACSMWSLPTAPCRAIWLCWGSVNSAVYEVPVDVDRTVLQDSFLWDLERVPSLLYCRF